MRLAADLRAAVLQAGISGKLTSQSPVESAEDVLIAIQRELETLGKKASRKTHSGAANEKYPPLLIPGNWKWVRLEEILKVQPSNGKSSPENITGKVKNLSLSATTSGSFNAAAIKMVDFDTDTANKYYLKKNDILIQRSNSRELVGTSCVYEGEDDLFVYPDLMMRMHLYDAVNVHYIDYVLKSPLCRGYFSKEAIGTSESMPKINQQTVKNAWIPLPPIEEQRRIVERISELMPIINEYEEVENRLVALKEAFPDNLRDAILQAAFLGQLTEQDGLEDSADLVDEILETKKRLLSVKAISRDNSCKTHPIDPKEDDLPDIPSNWTWVRLGSICSKIGAGSTPSGGSKVYVQSGVKFLREQNIHNSGLMMDGLVYITDEINSSMKGSQVQAKDILVNITGASIGRNALVPDDFDVANVNQHVLIVRLIDDRLRHYIHLCLQSPFIFNQMMDKQMGDKPGLSATKVANFFIPIPPLAEQQRVVERLNAILPLCDALAEGKA